MMRSTVQRCWLRLPLTLVAQERALRDELGLRDGPLSIVLADALWLFLQRHQSTERAPAVGGPSIPSQQRDAQ